LFSDCLKSTRGAGGLNVVSGAGKGRKKRHKTCKGTGGEAEVHKKGRRGRVIVEQETVTSIWKSVNQKNGVFDEKVSRVGECPTRPDDRDPVPGSRAAKD